MGPDVAAMRGKNRKVNVWMSREGGARMRYMWGQMQFVGGYIISTLTAATPPLSMKSRIPMPAIDLATKWVVCSRTGLLRVSGGSLAIAKRCAAVLIVTKT